MMILHIASMCAVSATALLHNSIYCRLHKTFSSFQHPPLFVFTTVFDIARSVRNFSGCTLLHVRDVKTLRYCRLTFSRFYVDFTFHCLLFISYIIKAFPDENGWFSKLNENILTCKRKCWAWRSWQLLLSFVLSS